MINKDGDKSHKVAAVVEEEFQARGLQKVSWRAKVAGAHSRSQGDRRTQQSNGRPQAVAVRYDVYSLLSFRAVLHLLIRQFGGLAEMNVQFCCRCCVQLCSCVRSDDGGLAAIKGCRRQTRFAPFRFERSMRGRCGSAKLVTYSMFNHREVLILEGCCCSVTLSWACVNLSITTVDVFVVVVHLTCFRVNGFVILATILSGEHMLREYPIPPEQQF